VGPPTGVGPPTATRSPTPKPPPPEPGAITDFETFGSWRRGAEPNGTFTQTASQIHQGNYAGRLDYRFETDGNDYVVFKQTHAIGGQPTRITAWVYGDGSDHFLNAWIRDKAGQVWQVPLGRIAHTGWQQMAGAIEPGQDWPWTHIDGPDNGTVDYPVSFTALVLDDKADSYTGSGTIYVDDLRADAETNGGTVTPILTGTSPTPSGSSAGRIAFTVYNPGISSYTLFTVKPDGSGLHAVADYVHQPDYSPNGQYLVVDGVGGGKNDLWTLKQDGSDWRQVTKHPDDHCPTWSPNGQIVGFSSPRQGDGVYRLYLGDSPVGTDRTKFILGDYPVMLPNWEWVFNGCDYGWGTGARCGMWRASAGNLPRQLTDMPQDMPTDATAEAVLFLRRDGDNWDVYRIGVGGGSPTRLTDSPGRDGPATFAPDGQTIAFLSERSGSWALYTMNRQGGSVKKILDLPLGGNYSAAPLPWYNERISWSRPASGPTPVPTPRSNLLPAPEIRFPIPEDVISSRKPTTVTWTWSRTLASNQGFEVRFWHVNEPGPMGIAPPTTATELTANFGMTDSYRTRGAGLYYLEVVVVQIDPYKVVSEAARIRVKADPNK
jgi:hypothetical protein